MHNGISETDHYYFEDMDDIETYFSDDYDESDYEYLKVGSSTRPTREDDFYGACRTNYGFNYVQELPEYQIGPRSRCHPQSMENLAFSYCMWDDDRPWVKELIDVNRHIA